MTTVVHISRDLSLGSVWWSDHRSIFFHESHHSYLMCNKEMRNWLCLLIFAHICAPGILGLFWWCLPVRSGPIWSHTYAHIFSGGGFHACCSIVIYEHEGAVGGDVWSCLMFGQKHSTLRQLVYYYLLWITISCCQGSRYSSWGPEKLKKVYNLKNIEHSQQISKHFKCVPSGPYSTTTCLQHKIHWYVCIVYHAGWEIR
jgi:hypothetical protein